MLGKELVMHLPADNSEGESQSKRLNLEGLPSEPHLGEKAKAAVDLIDEETAHPSFKIFYPIDLGLLDLPDS